MCISLFKTPNLFFIFFHYDTQHIHQVS
jgi:hypothetical protein